MRERLQTATNARMVGAPWWAQLQFTRVNIELTILHKKIEDLLLVLTSYFVIGASCQPVLSH
jgi:hypothetical protein